VLSTEPVAAAVQGIAPAAVTPPARTSTSSTQNRPLQARTSVQSGPQDDRNVTALPIVVGIWIAGVAALTLRLSLGWWRITRLHAASLREPASAWDSAAARIATKLGISRRVHVIDSIHIVTPTLIGWIRPVVLLPLAALASMPPDQVHAILAHEVAHIRRHDFLVNLVQSVAETVLFYHPGVWWLSARIRIEREHCCDDIAVAVCGDPIVYAEALTELASWTSSQPSLTMAATGGALLSRIRRLLHVPSSGERRHVKAPIVIALTVLLVLAVGMRFMLVAQSGGAGGDDRSDRVGPQDVNELLGYDLFPPRMHYPTDDPANARAWDVKVSYPGGEMSMVGFTARSLIRYAYDIGGVPVMDGPSWLDRESLQLRATTPSAAPDESDVRLALRAALEQQYGIAIGRAVRQFPVYGLVLANAAGALGPNLRPSTVDCDEGHRMRPAVFDGPMLVERSKWKQPCGIDSTFFGPRGYRVTMAEFALSLRGFPIVATPVDHVAVDREVVDQTGLTGQFDYTLQIGVVPLAAIATMHPDMLLPLRPLGIQTFPDAIEQQLGLRFVPTEAPREIAIIAKAHRPAI
jgi:uncharacterized protein (TIGR03435 family)